MRSKTTAALALAGATMTAAAPAAAQQDIPLRAELAGHPTVAAQMRAERRENVREDLVARAARLSDEPRAERRRLRGRSASSVRARIRVLRRPEPEPVAVAVPAHLQAIAACESGSDPTTDTGNGFYGKYQFTLSTWASVGGTGNPAAASEAEQDQRAAILYAREGASPWPVCGG